MIQKINTMHANPMRRGWVVSPEHWRYSSAAGVVPVLRCDEWRGNGVSGRGCVPKDASLNFGNEENGLWQGASDEHIP